VRQIRYVFDVGMDALYTFLADDGWAIASHIALSTLMALFPFLIVLTSLAGFFGSKELADQAAELMLQIWPKQVADTLSGEIHDVLTTTRGDVLTIGALLAVYFASNGVESLRVALNRAYAMSEPRRWYWLRLESIGYTLIAAFTALAMAFLIVLGPLLLEAARRHIPLIVESNENLLNTARYGIAILALVVALFILHAWLPAGRRGFLQIMRHHVCRPCIGHHRAGVSVFQRRDFRLWRRTERGDHQIAAAARRVASSSAVARARGLTGLTRNASAPAAREAASSSPRPDTPMIAMPPSGRLKLRIRLMASMPSMPGNIMSISTASKPPCPIRSAAASPRPMNSA
jgi:membrane protein